MSKGPPSQVAYSSCMKDEIWLPLLRCAGRVPLNHGRVQTSDFDLVLHCPFAEYRANAFRWCL